MASVATSNPAFTDQTTDPAAEILDEDDRRSPVRRCLATGGRLPKGQLIRFVLSPEGVITPDLDGRLPGRGLWVKADRQALQQAVRKGMFARAAKQSVQVPEDLAERVEALLVQRCIGLIGLARRAGQALAGFEKVRAWLKDGEAAVLLAARDGAAHGRGKLSGLAGDRPVVALLDAAELAAAFGRDHVVHGALASGGLANRFIAEAARLDGLRGGPEPSNELSDGMKTVADMQRPREDDGGYAEQHDR